MSRSNLTAFEGWARAMTTDPTIDDDERALWQLLADTIESGGENVNRIAALAFDGAIRQALPWVAEEFHDDVLAIASPYRGARS